MFQSPYEALMQEMTKEIDAAIAKDQPTPLRYVGVGEKIDDLKVFNAEDYVEGMIE